MSSSNELINSIGLKSDSNSLRAGVASLLKDFPSLTKAVECFEFDLTGLEKERISASICFSSPQTTAVILVDFQNDFVHGTLRTDRCQAKQNATEIVHKVNRLLQLPFKKVYVSCDWHPEDHVSFYENKDRLKLSDKNQMKQTKDLQVYDTVWIVDTRELEREQQLWPAHCIAETNGSKIFPEIKLPESHCLIKKGTLSDVECYSVFGDPHGIEDTGLDKDLRQNGIQTVVICGIALDFCVAESALDAVKRGYKVVVVEDACVGINSEGIKRRRTEMMEAGVHLTDCARVPQLLAGEFAPLQHVIQTVKNSRKEM